MSDAILQGDYEALDAIAKRFQQQSQQNNELIQRVNQRMKRLESTWLGMGSQAFFSEMQGEVMPAMKRLTSAMEQASKATTQISQLLRQAEEEAAALFKGEGGSGASVGAEMGAALGAGTAMGFAPPGAGGSVPPPRVYIVNGINSTGNEVAYDANGNPIVGDDQTIATKQLLEKYGYDPSQVKATQAVYLKPQTHLEGTNLSGTNTGFAPLDWLTGKAASGVNAVTGWGADKINDISGSGLVGSLWGSGQVFREYMQDGNGPYTRQVYNEISADLQANPLAPGQQVVLMGHSGGGAIIAPMTRMLEQDGHPVSGMITMGSPVSDYTTASRYAERVMDIRHAGDRIVAPIPGVPMIRSSAVRDGGLLGGLGTGTAVGGFPGVLVGGGVLLGSEAYGRSRLPGNISTVTLDRPTGYPHGSYMHDPAVGQDMIQYIRQTFPEMGLSPTPVR